MTDIIDIDGRYFVMVKTLGKGGFCRAQLAEDMENRRYVVVRELRTPDRFGKSLFRNGIKAQERINGRFGFPNIISHNERMSAADYVDGNTLDRFYRPGEDITLCIAYQASSSLDALHRMEILHRDVKPVNIIMTPKGEAKLIDYDTAHIIGTEKIPCVGTNGYMSPEQSVGAEEDARTDIFALGSTLWRLSTGRVLNSDDVRFEFDTEEQGAIVLGELPAKPWNYYRSKNPFERFCYQNLEEVDRSTDVGEVIATCWRVGRSYESAEHMKVEVADRLKRKGILPEDSGRVVSAWAMDNVRISP